MKLDIDIEEVACSHERPWLVLGPESPDERLQILQFVRRHAGDVYVRDGPGLSEVSVRTAQAAGEVML